MRYPCPGFGQRIEREKPSLGNGVQLLGRLKAFKMNVNPAMDAIVENSLVLIIHEALNFNRPTLQNPAHSEIGLRGVGFSSSDWEARSKT